MLQYLCHTGLLRCDSYWNTIEIKRKLEEYILSLILYLAWKCNKKGPEVSVGT